MTGLRHEDALAGYLGQWLTERIWDQMHPLDLACGDVETVCYEDVPGMADEDVVLRDVKTGRLYDIEIEVFARPRPAPQAPDAEPPVEVHPDQMTIDEVTA